MKRLLSLLAVGFAIFTLALAPSTALAQSDFGLEDSDIGQYAGQTEGTLKETVINVIQFVLGFLALIAVIMIIVGGFRWMTAGGNEDSVDKAKKIISAAVIGLVIVLLAWAIVIFVAQAILTEETPVPTP